MVDAVAEIAGGDDSEDSGSTFSALETKLEALLQDGIGGAPMVNIASSEDGDYSDLTIELELRWSLMESKEIGIDLGELLAEADAVEGLDNFLDSFVPSGEAGFDVQTELTFTLALGIEYNSITKAATPYIIGSSGLVVSFNATGDVKFKAAVGPLNGEVGAIFNIGNTTKPVEFQVGFEDGTNYYLANPKPRDWLGLQLTQRPNYEYLGGVPNILNKTTAGFSGPAKAEIEANIPLIGASAEFSVEIEDVNKVFAGEPGAIETTVDIKKPGISKPSFLQILLSDPTAIVSALDTVLEITEAASLGPRGIITTFPVPYTDSPIKKALGAGTPDNVIGQAVSRRDSKLVLCTGSRACFNLRSDK